MKKIIKLLAIILVVTMLMPFTVVNAKLSNVEKVIEKFNSYNSPSITAKYEDNKIEIEHASVFNNVSFSIDVDDNLIRYESGPISNYEQAKSVVNHCEYFKEFIMNTVLILKGYKQEQIIDYFVSENEPLTFEKNGIGITEIGEPTEYKSDYDFEGSITTQQMSMVIDLDRANLDIPGVDALKGTTVEDVIDYLNDYEKFYIFNEIERVNNSIIITPIEKIVFDCIDGVLYYESGDVTDYYIESDVIRHFFIAYLFTEYALEVNGYTEEQIYDFYAHADFNYELNGIEFLEIDGSKTFNTEMYSINTPAISIKIDFEKANIKREYKVTEGENQIFFKGENYSLAFAFDFDYDNFETYGDVWIDNMRIERDNYTFKSCEGTIIEFNDEFTNTLSEGVHHLEIPFAQGKLGIAKTDFTVEKIEKETKEYVINSYTNSGDSILFTAPEGEVYYLSINDIKDLTDEDLQKTIDLFENPEITFEELKEEYNKILAYGKKAAGDNGTLLKLYDINLYNNDDEIHEVEGGFKLKLKMTDDMKGYDSYKLIYIAGDGTTEEAIEFVINGEYLEGTLPHLSMYALVGNNTETETETTSNPKTGDNIAIWISLIVVSMIGIAGTVIFIKKNK